ARFYSGRESGRARAAGPVGARPAALGENSPYAYCIPWPFVLHNMQPKGVRVSSPNHPSPESPHQRLRVAREQAGFARASDAARAMGIEEPTYLGHENGSRGLSRAAPRYARFFGGSPDRLIAGRRGGALARPAQPPPAAPPPHARPGRAAPLRRRRAP